MFSNIIERTISSIMSDIREVLIKGLSTALETHARGALTSFVDCGFLAVFGGLGRVWIWVNSRYSCTRLAVRRGDEDTRMHGDARHDRLMKS
eukprot:4694834-Pleurochrysis_carterae.AAC.1